MRTESCIHIKTRCSHVFLDFTEPAGYSWHPWPSADLPRQDVYSVLSAAVDRVMTFTTCCQLLCIMPWRLQRVVNCCGSRHDVYNVLSAAVDRGKTFTTCCQLLCIVSWRLQRVVNRCVSCHDVYNVLSTAVYHVMTLTACYQPLCVMSWCLQHSGEPLCIALCRRANRKNVWTHR